MRRLLVPLLALVAAFAVGCPSPSPSVFDGGSCESCDSGNSTSDAGTETDGGVGSIDGGELDSGDHFDGGADAGSPEDAGDSGSDAGDSDGGGWRSDAGVVPRYPASLFYGDGGICSLDGWCWLAPQPHGNDWTDFAAFGPDDIWGVATAGTLAHWDGHRWTGVGDERDRFLTLAALAPDDIWVGGRPTMHWDGIQWSTLAEPPPFEIKKIVAQSRDDALAIGVDDLGTALTHWDGHSWSTPFGQTGMYNGLSSDGDGGYIMEGYNGLTTWSVDAGFAPLTGSYCMNWYFPYGTFAATGPDDIFAASTIGVCFEHFDGTSWARISVPPLHGPVRKIISPVRGEAILATDDSYIAYRPSTGAKGITTPAPVSAFGWDGQQLVVGGFRGWAVRDGLGSGDSIGTEPPALGKVTSIATRLDAGDWSAIGEFPAQNLMIQATGGAVTVDPFFASQNPTWISGAQDGTRFVSVLDSGTIFISRPSVGDGGWDISGATLTAGRRLYAVSETFAWSSGGTSTTSNPSQYWDGTGWRYMNAWVPPRISVRTADEAYGVTPRFQDVYAYQADAGRWVAIVDSNTNALPGNKNGICVTAQGELWAAGEARFLHFDGGSWAIEPAPPGSTFFGELGDIFCGAPGEVYATSEYGDFFGRIDGGWSQQRFPGFATGAFGATSDAVLVGANGGIVSHGR